MICTARNRGSISGLRVQAGIVALCVALILLVAGSVSCGGGAATHFQPTSQPVPQAAGSGSSPSSTPTFTLLYTFPASSDLGIEGNGFDPEGRLIQDSAGNLYGTTQGGPGNEGTGTVFKLDTAGNETRLHAFCIGCQVSDFDGESPTSGLVRDEPGNLYGVTPIGGLQGVGVVFKVDPLGNETVLYTFRGGADGATPTAELVRDANGNLYGVTGGGGACQKGTVFKLDPTGTETVLHSFSGFDNAIPDGSGPNSLIQDASGNFYGTTFQGGNKGCNCGTVFKLDSSGKETVLHSFSGPDGSTPFGRLIQDASGNLYGTTSAGGANGSGAIFKLDTTGKETLLYSFTGGPDGGQPRGGLVLDSSGNLYGATLVGGSASCHGSGFFDFNGCGIVYKLDPTGKQTVLHTFTGPDGKILFGGLISDSAGNLYGTASQGGDLSGNCVGFTGCGTIFKVTP